MISKLSLVILSIIVSLFYTLFDYYGGPRYFRLRYMGNIEPYISSYSSLDKYDDKRVVVSFSSSAQDLKKLMPMLASLLDQTVRIDEISLCVPVNTRDEDIPDYVKKIAIVYRVHNCVISTLMRERESDTDILFLKNNVIYGKDFIETVLSLKSDNNIIMNNEFILIKPDYIDEKVCDPGESPGSFSSCNEIISKYKKFPIDIVEYQENFRYNKK